MPDDKKSTLLQKLKRKLRIAVFVDKSYEQLFSIRLTPISMAVFVSAISVLLVAAVTVLIAFTGLREYIPGYPTGEERRLIIENLQRTDSLSNEIVLRDKILSNLRDVLSGALPIEAYKSDSVMTISRQSLAKMAVERTEAEADFLAEVEQAEHYDLDTYSDGVSASASSDMESMFFFSPMKGVVTNKFGEDEGHFGVDIVAADGTAVMSTLDGTVMFAEWTVQTGFVIIVQHDNQIVSVYKHNSKLLRKPGVRVHAGEAIAIVGNSGEQTTGPHLHFELWYQGAPLNPENYISFEQSKAE